MFENLTEQTKNRILVVTMVAVLVLLYLEAKRVGWLKEHMVNTYGASQKHLTTRSDIVGDFDPRGGSVTAEAQYMREGMGAYEPPVFWNAGSFANIGAFQKKSLSSRPLVEDQLSDVDSDDESQFATEGMRGRMNPGYTERMSASKLNPY